MRRLLQRADFIYVADCKLATEHNLARLAGFGGRFGSVMPRTRKEDRAFRQCVREGQVQWTHLLSRKNNRQPGSKTDRYYLAQGQYQASGFRLLWIRSTQKAQQDALTRSQRITKTLEALRELQTRLNTYKLKSRLAIEQALTDLLKTHHTQAWIGYQIQTHREYQKHLNLPAGHTPRVSLRSPVREYCTPGSVRGAPGNRCPYLDISSVTAATGLR